MWGVHGEGGSWPHFPLPTRETLSQGTDATCVTNASQGATTSLCTFARNTSSSGPQGTPAFGMSPNLPATKISVVFLHTFQQFKNLEFDGALMSTLSI